MTEKNKQMAPANRGPAPALAKPGEHLPSNPFARQHAQHLNAGAVAIESERAIAEAQGKLVIAKRFPRDPADAFERAMQACRRPELAKAAFYSFRRGGDTISGETIRLAEELARAWGNIEYGLRELSHRDGESEMEAYAWDLETNTKSAQQFTVRHKRDTSEGGKDLTSQRDIYELTANMGMRRLRERIFAVLPVDLKHAAAEQCRATLKTADGKPIAERIKDMVAAFAGLGVTDAQLAAYLKHPTKDTTADELTELLGVYTSIRDGETPVTEWFPAPESKPADGEKPAKGKGGGKAAASAPGSNPAPTADKPQPPANPPATGDASAQPPTSSTGDAPALAQPAQDAAPAQKAPPKGDLF